jgi:hypothetical protein
MDVTILVPEDTVIVDGRSLPIDCSSVDQNIRVVRWYEDGDYGEVEFANEPGKPFMRNGQLTGSLGEFRPILDAWQEQADKIDAVEQLKEVPPDEAVRIMEKIESEPTLRIASVQEAVRLLQKVERDPDLRNKPLGQSVETIKLIESEPMLEEVYPGVAHRALKEVDESPHKDKPIEDALIAVAMDADRKQQEMIKKQLEATKPPRPPETPQRKLRDLMKD